MSAALLVNLAYATLAIVGVLLLVTVAVMRELRRMTYRWKLRWTVVAVAFMVLGFFGTVAGFAYMLGAAS